MKRVCVEPCIFLRIQDNGKLSRKCFEVVKARTIQNFREAIELFKFLYKEYETVYIYETRIGYRVVFQTYVDCLDTAREIRNTVEGSLGVFENDEK